MAQTTSHYAPRSTPPPNLLGDDAGRGDSPEGSWTGGESGPDATPLPESQQGLKRKRPMSVSCELCKQRKVKCDRAQPSCGWCSRNAQTCEYKERKKPGLRAGYGRELEQRLDRLEEIINTQGRMLEAHILSQRNPSQQQQSLGRPQSSSLTQSQTIHGDGAQSDGRVGTQTVRSDGSVFSQRVSSFSTTHHGQPTGLHEYDPSITASTPSIQQDNGYQQQLSSVAPNGHSASGLRALHDAPQEYYPQSNSGQLESPVNLSSSLQSPLTDGDVTFPPYDLLYALVDLYFKHINTWCPILHRRTTLEALFGPPRLDEDDRILLHAIVATTLRFSTDSRLNDQNRKHFHDSSKQKVLLYGLENSSVKALQALVILALDLVGSSNGPPGWNLLALLTRSVVQLGLSVESTSSLVSPNIPSVYTLRAAILPESNSFVEDESRRRLFWMIYLLDRYATIATTFDFALDEKEIDRKLPCRDDLIARNKPADTRWFRTSQRTDYSMNRTENIGAFGFYVEILGIYSKVHRFSKTPIDISALADVTQWQATYRELETELTNWKFDLPNEYGNSSRIFSSGGNIRAVDCGWVMLHATYHTAMIRLHSCAAYPTIRSPIFTPSYSASQRCLVAVESITTLAQYVVNNGMLDKLGPPFAFSLWVCARLLLVHGSTIEHKVDPNIMFFVDTLREMAKYWQVAGRYTSILQRVLDEYRESERSLGANGERITPSTVKLLADMRRCAFDLDFIISRQPRQVSSNYVATAATPARTPAPNELEYLDVFDFFNMPRLPTVQPDPITAASHPSESASSNNNIAGAVNSLNDSSNNTNTGVQGKAPISDMATPSNEFNITNFMTPNPETDWLFRANS